MNETCSIQAVRAKDAAPLGRPTAHGVAVAVAIFTASLLGACSTTSSEVEPSADAVAPEAALALAQGKQVGKTNFVLCSTDACPVHTYKRMLMVRRPPGSASAAPDAAVQTQSALILVESTPAYLLFDVAPGASQADLVAAIRRIDDRLPRATFHWLLPSAAGAAELVAATTAAGVEAGNVTTHTDAANFRPRSIDGTIARTPGGTTPVAEISGPFSPASAVPRLLAVKESNLAAKPPQAPIAGKPTVAENRTAGKQTASAQPQILTAGPDTEQAAAPKPTTVQAAAGESKAQVALNKAIALHVALDPRAAEMYAADAEVITTQTVAGVERSTSMNGMQLRGALRNLYPAAKVSGAAVPAYSDVNVSAGTASSATATGLRKTGSIEADVTWTLAPRDGRWLIVREVARIR